MASLLRVGAEAGAERGAIKLVRWVIGHTVGRVNVDDETIARAIRERAEHGPGVVRAAEREVGCALCFPAGTRVATPHGERAIQSLRVGDTVLAENPATGKVEAEPVQATIQDPRSPLIAVQLSDGSAITVTADHPFWVDAGDGLAAPGWIAAGALRPGDLLRTVSGTDAVVGIHRQVDQASLAKRGNRMIPLIPGSPRASTAQAPGPNSPTPCTPSVACSPPHARPCAPQCAGCPRSWPAVARAPSLSGACAPDPDGSKRTYRLSP